MENAKRLPTLRIPAKASLWYIGSSAIARLIGALSTPIFTRLLTPEEYGLYPLYNTWLGIFTVVITMEITGAAIYRGLQRHSEDSDGFIRAALGRVLLFFGVFCLLYAVFPRGVNTLTGLDSGVTMLMLTEILGATVLSLYTAKARFEYRYRAVALINILTAMLTPLVSVSIIYLTDIRAQARIIASSVTAFALALPIFFTVVKGAGRVFNPEIWGYLLKRSLPLLPHYLAMTMILKVGELGVSRLYGAAALGKYSVALSLGMALTVVTGGVLSALAPWMLRRMKECDLFRVRELLFILTELVSLCCLGLLAVVPEALSLFSSSQYHAILPAVYPIALSVIPTFLSSALMSGGVYFEKGWLSALPSIVSATVSAILTATVLPLVDYRFVSLFALVSYTVLAALNVAVFTRLSKTPPIHVTKTLVVFLVTCAYAALLFTFREIILSRFLLTLPLLPILLNVAKEALKRIKE